MEQWNFIADVYVEDGDPSLDWLHEIAEIECKIHVECELDFGQAESYWDGPARPRRANLIESKLDEMNFIPHDPDEDAELKFQLLLTDEIREQIEHLALGKLKDQWRSRYAREAFETCREYYLHND